MTTGSPCRDSAAFLQKAFVQINILVDKNRSRVFGAAHKAHDSEQKRPKKEAKSFSVKIKLKIIILTLGAFLISWLLSRYQSFPCKSTDHSHYLQVDSGPSGSYFVQI